jgi:hypothetical protein
MANYKYRLIPAEIKFILASIIKKVVKFSLLVISTTVQRWMVVRNADYSWKESNGKHLRRRKPA